MTNDNKLTCTGGVTTQDTAHKLTFHQTYPNDICNSIGCTYEPIINIGGELTFDGIYSANEGGVAIVKYIDAASYTIFGPYLRDGSQHLANEIFALQ